MWFDTVPAQRAWGRNGFPLQEEHRDAGFEALFGCAGGKLFAQDLQPGSLSTQMAGKGWARSGRERPGHGSRRVHVSGTARGPPGI